MNPPCKTPLEHGLWCRRRAYPSAWRRWGNGCFRRSLAPCFPQSSSPPPCFYETAGPLAKLSLHLAGAPSLRGSAAGDIAQREIRHAEGQNASGAQNREMAAGYPAALVPRTRQTRLRDGLFGFYVKGNCRRLASSATGFCPRHAAGERGSTRATMLSSLPEVEDEVGFPTPSARRSLRTHR